MSPRTATQALALVTATTMLIASLSLVSCNQTPAAPQSGGAPGAGPQPASFMVSLPVRPKPPQNFVGSVPISSLQLDNAVQEIGKPAANKSADGNQISLAGQKFPNGIGAQANCRIILKLDGGSERFTATVGVDDEVQGKDGGTVGFLVTGDGQQLYPAFAGRGGAGGGRGAGGGGAGRGGRGRGAPAGPPPVHAGDAAQKIDIDVKGIRVLILETTNGNDNNTNDHGDWADAKLQVNGVMPEIVPPSIDQPIVLTPPAADTPRINSTKIFGVRPGHPILYTIAATGKRPMTFSADNLPVGVKLDAATGMLSGSSTERGTHAIKFHAKNAQGTADSAFNLVVGDNINLTPQLGWNSWNCFGSSVSADKVKAAADAMVNSGLVNHGWSYVNVDDFWEKNANQARNDATMAGPARDANGEILPNGRFPSMKALADYIHSKGMKAGLYSSPGPTTCGGCTASYQHEEQDAQSWATWGFDYIKYDLCSYTGTAEGRANNPNSSPANAEIPYKLMGDALKKVDRDIIYSLCQYGQQDVGAWAQDVGGNSWRTTGDIRGAWTSVTQIMDQQVGREKYAGPGHWNDPDMLVVGRTAIGSGNNPTQGLSANEMYTHYSAWIMLDAPMLIGCDMTKMDAFTLGLLSNDEVLAVSQDPLGQQAVRVVPPTRPFPQTQPPAGSFQVYAKKMSDGSMAVGIFSRLDIDESFPVKWSDLGISGKQTVRDLWRQKDVGTADGEFTPTVPRHGVVLVKISPAK